MKRLLIKALLLVAVSCNTERGKTLLIDPPKPTEATEAYLHLSIKRPNDVVLRTLNEDNPMNRIQTLSLLFYDATTNTLESIRELSVNTKQDLSSIVTKVSPKDYKLVVLANPSEEVKAITRIGTPLSTLNEAQELGVNHLYNKEHNTILMSNAQGAVTVTRDKFLRSGAPTDPSNRISLSLEPALARVIVYGNPSLRMGTKGSQEAKYQVHNVLKKVTILRQLNKLSNGIEEQANDNSDRSLRYAKSYPWDNWQQSTSISEVATRDTEKSSASAMKLLITPSLEDVTTETLNSILAYHKEIALPSQAFVKGATPYVLIAYPYIPTGLTLSADEGWLSYKGKYYTEGSVRALLASASQANKPENIALKEALERNNITAAHLSAGFSTDGINFYHKAYNYYAVFIKHFGDNTEANYGKYGLVRGNEYRIKITEVGSQGSPIPILYHNNLEPIQEVEQSNIAVSIVDVTRRTQESEL